MEKIRLSETLELSRVVMGCMRLADSQITGEDLLKLVETCLDMGVTSIDHAPVYGGYTCEKIFGDAVLRKRPELRDKMQLITKTGIVCPGKNGNRTIYYNSTKEEILKEMDESLEKLGTDHVDLLLVHRPDPLADPSETADALETLVKQGKALHVGVSNFMPSQMEMLQSRMRIRLVTNQMELSVKNTENFLMVYWMMHLQEGFRLWRGRRLAEEASFAAGKSSLCVCAVFLRKLQRITEQL